MRHLGTVVQVCVYVHGGSTKEEKLEKRLCRDVTSTLQGGEFLQGLAQPVAWSATGIRQDLHMANGHGDWWALVGPLPLENPTGITPVSHDRPRTLSGPFQVGALKLRPGELMYREP